MTYSPLTIVTMRIITVVLLVGIIYLIRRPAMCFRKKDYKYLALISLFEPCLYFVGESYALQEMSATTVSLLQNIFPFFLPGIILLFRVEKIKPVILAGFIISLIGVYLLSYSRLPMWNVTPKGIIYLLLCAGSILFYPCLLYTSDAADDLLCVDFGGCRNTKKKKKIFRILIQTEKSE